MLFERVYERLKRFQRGCLRIIRICGSMRGLENLLVIRVNFILAKNCTKYIRVICEVSVECANTNASASGHLGRSRPISTNVDNNLPRGCDDCGPGPMGTILEWLYRRAAVDRVFHIPHVAIGRSETDTYSCACLRSFSARLALGDRRRVLHHSHLEGYAFYVLDQTDDAKSIDRLSHRRKDRLEHGLSFRYGPLAAEAARYLAAPLSANDPKRDRPMR
jgi:hypothetical protein